MRLKFCLILAMVLAIGVQPLRAQDDETPPPLPEEPALAEEADDLEEEPTLAAETDDAKKEPALAAETDDAEAEPALAAETDGDDDEFIINIRNNRYFRESRRLGKLAEEAFAAGDYDGSSKYAEEAALYALQSDVYAAIAVAKYRLDQAVSTGASKKYPSEYKEAEIWYEKSIGFRDEGEWNDSIDAAQRVVALLASPQAPDGVTPLPASYIVRAWITFKDCLWNIAGRPWVYGDPFKWRVLYNANKSKLPNPNNPNLIEPGMVLDIPSVKGETRSGVWDSGRTYSPFN